MVRVVSLFIFFIVAVLLGFAEFGAGAQGMEDVSAAYPQTEV